MSDSVRPHRRQPIRLPVPGILQAKNTGVGCHCLLRSDIIQFSSVQFSRSVMSNSLRPHGLQHAIPPCPSPIHRVYSNSSPLSWWCHPTISSSVVPFSSCLQSFPSSGSFQTSKLFASGGQSIGVSASTSVLPMNTQDWFPLEWTGLCSLRDSQESYPTPQFKSINSSVLSFLYSPTLTSILNLFLYMIWEIVPVSFFCKELTL